MTKQRFPDYRSRPSPHDGENSDRSRRSSRPDPHDRREYDTRGCYDGGGGDRGFQPVKLSGLGAGFPMSESPSVKFQWNNLMDRKPDSHNPAANPGPRRPEFGFSNESDAYRLNPENGYVGGGGEIRVSDHHPGPDPAGRYGYSPHGFTSPPLPNSHVGAPKGEDFRVRDHNAYMGQADTTAFRAGPGFRCISDEFSRSREMGPPPMAYGGYSQAQIPPLNEFVGTIDHSRAPSYGCQFRPGSSTQEISQLNSYPSFVEQAQPSIASYQPLNQQQAVPTRGFGFGGDDGLERGLEAVSFEGALRSNALVVEGGLRADEVKTLKMCARRRKLAQRGRRRRGNEPSDDSQSDLSDDEEDIGEYPALGGFEWSNHQVGGQWNIDQNSHLGDDQLNMNQNVGFVEDQMSIGGIHQGGMYGGHEWNDLNNLNSENMLPSSRPPAAMQEHSTEHFQSNRRDIKARLQHPLKLPGGMKKRLGPVISPDSIKRRLGPVKPPGSIMKRLGPAQDHVPNVKLLGSKSQEHYKPQIRGTDCFSGSIHAQRSGLPISKGKHAKEELPKAKPAKKELLKAKPAKKELLKAKPAKKELPKAKPALEELPTAKPAKKELPEDSVEFKKLVDSAFLKYIKALYDIPASLTTKCCICASNSKEFAGTVALAKHAFMSPMGRFRAEHLGYHKALCVLLGWDSGVVENGTWVQRFLPDAEALALREDLFIWPPVVFIHNTSIANINPQERLIVSVEGLEAILKAIGFGGGKTKVCRGKSENQSIMVVAFSATFSGLRDAERLHNLFAENKHGRPEFQQISSSGGDQSLQANNVNCLYGYLALAEDLDKFEAETKKRCVVRSKKEVQAIADASL